MPALVPVVVAIPFVFVAWVVNRVLQHRYEVAKLKAGRDAAPALPPSGEVEQRLANLEAIVCSEDRDLARRIAA